MSYIKTKLSYILLRLAANLNPKLITKVTFQKQVPQGEDWNFVKQAEIEGFTRRCLLRYLSDYMQDRITIEKVPRKSGKVDMMSLEFTIINKKTK